MDIFFPAIAFLIVFVLSFWSLGLGVLGVFAIGYFNGIIRANFLGAFTTFMFDVGLLALYIVFFFGKMKDNENIWRTGPGKWTIALIAWPTVMVFVPINDYLVQLVAWRGTVYFLPIMVIGAQLRPSDLSVISRGLSVLNLITLAVGAYIYLNGVEALYPHNAVTDIMYKSVDVAGGKHRIPSTFLHAHGYGGTMILSLPFILERLFGKKSNMIDRLISSGGVVAALGGILMCAARYPVILLIGSFLVLWILTRFNIVMALVAGVVGAGALQVAMNDERLQRFTTLEDTDYVTNRVNSSANNGFLELIMTYPAGAGMGSGVGNSVPFFLADRAPEQIGFENEFSRILVDQGLIGLALWISFLIWLFLQPPPCRLDLPWGLGVLMMFSLTFVNWSTSFIGTGTLAAIPGAVLLLTQMGVVGQIRESVGTDRP